MPRVHRQAISQLQQVMQAEVALAALDLADVGPVQSAVSGQLLLRDAAGVPSGAHALAQRLSCGRDWGRHEWLYDTEVMPLGPESRYPETSRLVTMRPVMVNPHLGATGHGLTGTGG